MTASLELCKELFELSGWNDVEWYRNSITGQMIAAKDKVYRGSDIPAYDLGYLLRKLHMQQPVLWLSGFGSWEVETQHEQKASDNFEATASTPENALCKLAIELFKAGVLKEGK